MKLKWFAIGLLLLSSILCDKSIDKNTNPNFANNASITNANNAKDANLANHAYKTNATSSSSHNFIANISAIAFDLNGTRYEEYYDFNCK